jgi:hypothetical protein
MALAYSQERPPLEFQFRPAQYGKSQSIKRTAKMDKSVISQLLDGAAFPAIMLAVAVSQMNVEPNRKDTLRHRERPAAGLQMDDRDQPKAQKAHKH